MTKPRKTDKDLQRGMRAVDQLLVCALAGDTFTLADLYVLFLRIHQRHRAKYVQQGHFGRLSADPELMTSLPNVLRCSGCRRQ